MMAALDLHAANRLAKLCGMLSSDHAGERANAAALATRALHAAGLDWSGLVAAAMRGGAYNLPPRLPTSTPAHRALALWALERVGRLSERDADFLRTIAPLRTISSRQAEWLNDIADRLRRDARS